MRSGVSIVLFGLAVGLLVGCASPEVEMEFQLEKSIETMLEALHARDDGAILAIAANPQNFGENGRLRDDVAGFLYDGDYIRGYDPDARSVVEIMALGSLRVHIVRENGSRATALFIPEQFVELAQALSFYGERWMRDYFACEFHLIDGRWLLLYNICFAESDGPYPGAHGMLEVPWNAVIRL